MTQQCKFHNDIVEHQAECRANVKTLFKNQIEIRTELNNHTNGSEPFRRLAKVNEESIKNLCVKVKELKNDSKGFVWGLIIVLFQIANIIIALKK